ncbi:hypothetical protein MMC15_003910 [Xylographa vitiligo]|nr:hypothetical protein [Xylographa vitiligo]
MLFTKATFLFLLSFSAYATALQDFHHERRALIAREAAAEAAAEAFAEAYAEAFADAIHQAGPVSKV